MAISQTQRAALQRAFKSRTPADHTTLPNNPASIRKFQTYHNLPATGKIDAATQKKMNGVNTTLGNSPATGAGNDTYAKRSASFSGGYGLSGKSSYKPIEDQRGGQAERTAYDQQAAAYERKRRAGAGSYNKGNRPG